MVSTGHVWAFGSSSVLKPSGAAFNKGSLECLHSVCICIYLYFYQWSKKRESDRQTESQTDRDRPRDSEGESVLVADD